MFAPKNEDAHMISLSNYVSDLLVAMDCLDAPELLHQAHILMGQAEKYGAPMLRGTAHKMERAAIAVDFDAARSLLPELNQNLRQALESMRPVVISSGFVEEPS